MVKDRQRCLVPELARARSLRPHGACTTPAFTCRARLNDRPASKKAGRTSAPCLVQRVVVQHADHGRNPHSAISVGIPCAWAALKNWSCSFDGRSHRGFLTSTKRIRPVRSCHTTKSGAPFFNWVSLYKSLSFPATNSGRTTRTVLNLPDLSRLRSTVALPTPREFSQAPFSPGWSEAWSTTSSAGRCLPAKTTRGFCHHRSGERLNWSFIWSVTGVQPLCLHNT